jgi:hypothetical protein
MMVSFSPALSPAANSLISTHFFSFSKFFRKSPPHLLITTPVYRPSPHCRHRRHRPPRTRRLLPCRLAQHNNSLGHARLADLHPRAQLRPYRLPLPSRNPPLSGTPRSPQPRQHCRSPLHRRKVHHRIQRSRISERRDQAERFRRAGSDY